MPKVSSSISKKLGEALQYLIAFAVATKVKLGRRTSSFLSTPRYFNKI